MSRTTAVFPSNVLENDIVTSLLKTEKLADKFQQPPGLLICTQLSNHLAMWNRAPNKQKN